MGSRVTCSHNSNIMENEDSDSTSAVSVKRMKDNWQRWSDKHQEYQKQNPFSQAATPSTVVPHRGQDDYGRPMQGSKTEKRGNDANTHISREVQELCKVIRSIGEMRKSSSGGDHITVLFGKLFEHYVTISNKLVGILLQARKHGLVYFEGEMLWQGKDDNVTIALL
ncbi:actin-binding Rho-activating protein isoform X1 [Cynoglossus semilaevis]|nr:actin-binding Rho-activating protein-like isoform X1 [Cynoglossus semilaevis]XP_024917497.1 actin-binding Rho-activating protein-like isoform X1 [Cynoglossus semilaevis]